MSEFNVHGWYEKGKTMTKMGPCAKVLSNHPEYVRDTYIDHLPGMVKWKERHIGAWTMPTLDFDRSIRHLLVSYATMADMVAYDSQLGEDGYFGDHARGILRAARAWLNMHGATQLSMGALDGLILQLAAASGIDPDSL